MKRDYAACVKSDIIRPIEKLDDRSAEIVELVKYKLEFWKKVIGIAENYPTILIEVHYELIKELLTALMHRDGFTSETHDCLFYYVEEKHSDMELDFEFLHELRKARNDIDYRGIKVPYKAWSELKMKIMLTIRYLIRYMEKE